MKRGGGGGGGGEPVECQRDLATFFQVVMF